MKTTCPIIMLATCVNPGMFGDITPTCNGPNCQLWHKCRRPDQCPKCGATGEPEEYARGYECPNGCGWFDKAGDLIEYTKEGNHETDKTVA